MKNRSHKLLLGAAVAVLACSPSFASTTLTFAEHPSSGLGDLDLTGDTFYHSYGVLFQAAILFGPDGRLPDDGLGIYNRDTAMSVHFFDPVSLASAPQSLVSFTWATAGDGISFNARAYDASFNLVDSFQYLDTPGGDDVHGVASLSGPGIVQIIFNDGGARIGVDTLTFDNTAVPDAASTLGLLGLAFAGLASLRRSIKH